MQTIVSRELHSSFVTIKLNEVDLVVQGKIFLYNVRWNCFYVIPAYSAMFKTLMYPDRFC